MQLPSYWKKHKNKQLSAIASKQFQRDNRDLHSASAVVKLQWSLCWKKGICRPNVAAAWLVRFVTGQQCLHKQFVSVLTCLFPVCSLQKSEESLSRSQPCHLQRQQRSQLCLSSPHCLSNPALLHLHPHPRCPLQWESYQTCTWLACWTCRETGLYGNIWPSFLLVVVQNTIHGNSH